MHLTDAFKSIIKPHDNDVLTPLSTVWGEQLDTENVLQEYPRPKMERDSYINLNGYWNYAFTSSTDFPVQYEGQILVPFSPEASLSGLNRQLQPDEYLWYETILPLQNTPAKNMRLLLHFGAVDYDTEVFVNSQSVVSHQGGYLPFEVDITDYVQESDNRLVIRVQDTTELESQARGKQTLRRGGIFYTAQSGIWQTVWMEWVPASYISNLWFETNYDQKEVIAHVKTVTSGPIPPLTLSVYHNAQKIIGQSISLNGQESNSIVVDLSFTIPDSSFQDWSPETPYLYDVHLTFGDDFVKSYFAMRLFTIEKPDGIPVFCLNHQPYFLMGVLDQGYWPDGLYTAPSEEALLYDITTMKNMGFNMLRKHIKVETARWYYHCDRLGMIVCQDMVNGGSLYSMPVISYLPTLFPRLAGHLDDKHSKLLSRQDEIAKIQWEKETMETVSYLKFFPSIAIWVPFNEGWGQFDTQRITDCIREMDSSRLIDSASGWFDQQCGDFISQHNYFRSLTVPVTEWGDRAFFLSEYGGYTCHIKEHSSVNRVFGYRHYNSLEEFEAACMKLIQEELLPLREKGLSGAVFTQLSDIEEEVNGILTYDRKIQKLTTRFPTK